MEAKKFIFTYSNHRHGGETKITVPAKREVCPECDGSGKVLCDGLRGAVIDQESLDDVDFRQSYFGGDYDVTCDICHGQNVVMVPDESRMTARQMLLWETSERERCERETELRHEQQMRERGIEW